MNNCEISMESKESSLVFQKDNLGYLIYRKEKLKIFPEKWVLKKELDV